MIKIGPALIIFLLFNIPVKILSSPAENERSEIGLALSGGGARGFAHLGVLQVLEENRIPVDYVAGTSMGSIIGGLYASGMSVEEIIGTVTEVDWSDVFDDRPSRRMLSFYNKKVSRQYLFNFELGIRDGKIVLPSGIIAGQKLNLLLGRLTLAASIPYNFRRFPIPFSAVAADISTGEKVVLNSGNLARAMRASMAIPFMFSPVRRDGRILVDGGITENLPVETVREMGAGAVIAVDVSTPLKGEDEIKSMFDIFRKTLGLVTSRNVEESRAGADLVISLDQMEFSTSDFAEWAPIIEAGRRAARALLPELGQYALSEEEYARYRKDHRPPSPPAPFRPDFIRIEGTERVAPESILSQITFHPGEEVDFERLDKEISLVYGMDYFEFIACRPTADSEGREGLLLAVGEKEWGPNYVHAGFNFSDDFEGNLDFNFLINVNLTNLTPRGAEWRNDLVLGTEQGARSEFYLPLDWKRTLFVAPTIFYREFSENIFQGSHKIAEYRVKFLGGGVFGGIQISNIAEISTGYLFYRARAETSVGDTRLPDYDIEDGAWVVEAKADTLNHAHFPTGGTFFDLSAEFYRRALGGDIDYESVNLLFMQYLAATERLTLFAHLQAGSSLDSDMPDYAYYTLGGPYRFTGYAEGRFRGKHIGLLSLGGFYRIGSLPRMLGEGIYLGAWFDAGNVWQTSREVEKFDLRYGGGMAAGLDTVVGPVYLVGGLAEGARMHGCLTVGVDF